MTPETRRQLVHLSVVGFAVPVPFLGPRWAVILACVAVFANWVVFPLSGRDRDLMREGESYFNGIRFYPVAVLLANLLLPLALAQATWGVLAVGDSFSNLFGRRYGTVKLPWNRRKSWAGTFGFLATAFPAALALLLFTQRFAPGASFLAAWSERGQAGPWSVLEATSLAFVGALVAAIVESLPIRVDDNLTVTFGAGAAMAAVVAILL